MKELVFLIVVTSSATPLAARYLLVKLQDEGIEGLVNEPLVVTTLDGKH